MYKKPTENLKILADKTFKYAGSKFQVFFDSDKYQLTNKWCEGTRNHAKIVRIGIDEFDIEDLPEMTTPEVVTIPNGFFILEHCIFQGKDLGIRIYMHPDDVPPEEKARLIAEAEKAKQELSSGEKIVLHVFAGWISKARKEEIASYGLTNEQYEQALAGLKEKKLISKGNAITLLGKNIRAGFNVHDLVFNPED